MTGDGFKRDMTGCVRDIVLHRRERYRARQRPTSSILCRNKHKDYGGVLGSVNVRYNFGIYLACRITERYTLSLSLGLGKLRELTS